MRIAHFECIGGASGDMILGAFVDAGLPLEDLRQALTKLGIEGIDLDAERVDRRGIAATRVIVRTAESQTPRHLSDIEKILASSQLPDAVKEQTRQAFGRLATAEAKVHGTTPEKIHFHEVGALDAIADVVGAMLCASLMGIERVTTSTFRLGRGTLQMAHGTFPIPAPATVEILRDWPVEFTDIPFELTTPTGAAVLTTLTGEPQRPPSFRIDTIGYGAGSRDLEELPNVLRLTVGQEADPVEGDRAVLVEANIDDMNPELYPHLLERLLEHGALDAYLTPIIMKKGRPGIVVSVLIPPEIEAQIADLLFQESTTIGVRMHEVRRRKLPREIIEVDTSLGRVKAKRLTIAGRHRYLPEYEECRRLALEKALSLRDVYARLTRELDRLSEGE